jgi:hypothetical protein
MNQEMQQPDDLQMVQTSESLSLAPWLIAGNTATVLVWGYVVLGELAVRDVLPEPLAWLMLLALAVWELVATERRYTGYVPNKSAKQLMVTLVVALVLFFLAVLIATLMGGMVRSVATEFLLLLGCLGYCLYYASVSHRRFAELPKLSLWWRLLRGVIVGAVTIAVTLGVALR